MDTTDLEFVLNELNGKIPTAHVAKQRADDSITPFAQKILEGLAQEIEYRIVRNEKALVTEIRIELDSPVLSLVVAVLRKLDYFVRCDAMQEGTQVSINWNV